MVVLVLSCDKNEDTFEAFHHCMEKYWEGHPEVIYSTETVQNQYYKTICHNEPIERWTKRIRETLNEIEDNEILLMVDDCFIRSKVDIDRIEYAREHLKGNIAMFNFEKSFDNDDEETALKGFKKRRYGASYEVSIMCGLWNKEKLMKVLEEDSNPWDIEAKQDGKGYDYYINSGDFIIDWGYKTWKYAGICKGMWCKEIIPFFEKEGIVVDYNKRGFYD